MSGVAVGIDLGGTKIVGGVVTDDGQVLHTSTQPTPAREGAKAVLHAVTELARALSGWAGAQGLHVVGCGAGIAGTVDPAGTVTHATDALPGWAGTNVSGALAEALQLPTLVVNDVHALALAEHRLGAAAGAHDALVVAIGTGIGGALIQHGSLVLGRTGTAGAIGHIPAPSRDARPCPCGRTGHLEAYASGPAIVAQYVSKGGQAERLEQVAAQARGGDTPALTVIRDAATTLGHALGGVATLLDPDVIVIGGGVAQLGDLLLEPLERALRTEALPGPNRTRVAPAVLGPAAGMIGAAILTFDPSHVPVHAQPQTGAWQ